MQTEGTSITEARKKIWMMDIDGLLAIGRPEGRLEGTLFVNKFHMIWAITSFESYENKHFMSGQLVK